MLNRHLPLFVSGALLLSTCRPAAAQPTGSARPFHGALFASHGSDSSAHALDVSGLFLEAYDDNVLLTVSDSVDPRAPKSGFHTLLQPRVNYSLTRRGVRGGVTAASAVGYYPDFHKLVSISHVLDAGLSVKAAQRSTIVLNQTVAYSPPYLSGLFPSSPDESPGDSLQDAPNFAIRDVDSYSYDTTALVSFGLTDRMTASFGGNYRFTDFRRETPLLRDQNSQGFDSHLSYQRTRNVGIEFSYHSLTGNLASGGTVDINENRLTAGISYTRPLSATRRMNLRVNLGGLALHSAGAPADFPDRFYRTSADARVEYPFARFWKARGTFRRGLEFVPGLSQPVYANGITAGLDGLLNRRVEIGFVGGYSQGRSALTPTASQFDTYNGSARLQYAVANSTAIHVEYFYYFYDFREAGLVISGAPRQMERNGVRLGLRLFVPVVGG